MILVFTILKPVLGVLLKNSINSRPFLFHLVKVVFNFFLRCLLSVYV